MKKHFIQKYLIFLTLLQFTTASIIQVCITQVATIQVVEAVHVRVVALAQAVVVVVLTNKEREDGKACTAMAHYS